ncbi:TolC family protein [Adhaeribacter aquaticus]|uniref:TolC family protein n=1 Tax=Adhaeribacter aquaticus TaxID=299567 RepID=UPI0009FC785E|nr:TolC family protein [Adhaeribacter aquaticus]
MRRFRFIGFLIFITLQLATLVKAQEHAPLRVFTLKQVVSLAKSQSSSYRYASVLLENKTWQYKNYKSNFLPQLNLNGTLPEFNKTIEPRLTDKGSLTFINTHNANSSLQLSLGQELGFTGGHISINSQIKRIDDFQVAANGTRYSSIPYTVTYNQPFFGYRWLSWEKKIQPLKYEEAKREYLERMEIISEEASTHFFNLLLSQISFQIAKKNVINSDTLYKVSLKRFNEGKMPENELLQMELTLLNARQNLEQVALDVEGSTLRLKVYIGLVDDEPMHLVPPTEIPKFDVNEKVALEQAHKNRQRMIGFQRELLEAEQNLARAKGETGVRANLFASFGLTQQSLQFAQVYDDPSAQQRVHLGFNIPIMDWGRTAGRLGTAKANQELVKTNVEQQRINFDQDIYLNVKMFRVLRDQMEIARRSDEIADKRYIITKERYLKGGISLVDLNIATEERDKATKSYISALNKYWHAYYHIRRITLYDFELDEPLMGI